jgi:hypothetical protein
MTRPSGGRLLHLGAGERPILHRRLLLGCVSNFPGSCRALRDAVIELMSSRVRPEGFLQPRPIAPGGENRPKKEKRQCRSQIPEQRL